LADWGCELDVKRGRSAGEYEWMEGIVKVRKGEWALGVEVKRRNDVSCVQDMIDWRTNEEYFLFLWSEDCVLGRKDDY